MRYDKIQTIIKNPKRPNVVDFATKIFDNFTELRGDKVSGEDGAILCGVAKLYDRSVVVIGHRRGKTTDQNIEYRFGMPNPAGYRKAIRMAEYAEKFKMPIVCFVDTAGAYPGYEAEVSGQGMAIAKCIEKFTEITVPVISIITGEGGSGGALALATANEVYMLTNAVYSVISPRGFASILWKDPKREQEAFELLKMTSTDLYKFDIIEGVIDEGKNNKEMYKNIKEIITSFILRYDELSPLTIKEKRQEKFRKIAKIGE